MNRTVVRKRIRRAFTLLEVLMVIVILGVLAALIIPQFAGTQDRANKDLTKSQLESLGSDLERFKLHCARYPSTEEGLAVLLVKPSTEDLAEKWAGPYIKKEAKDAWGRPLQYRSPGQYNQDSYDLWSTGKDGQDGTEDDIKNWERT